ncbi:hypothetical protein GGR57DRAFT_521018 [Xylariaceae sp. FL1272]|nr:hypothetical protein GGR57DRAFT_521018 [Xylariaceae sp. FL1272]
MDNSINHNLYLGNSEERAGHPAMPANFTGLVDEFLIFGDNTGFNDQHLYQSLYEADNTIAFNSQPQVSYLVEPLGAPYSPVPPSDPSPGPSCRSMSESDVLDNTNTDGLVDNNEKPRCWDHGCNGREFSSKSNLMRHIKEKSGASNKCCCPLCGAIFTRSSARDTHLAKQSCNKIRRYSNGRPRPSRLAILENPQVAAAAARTAASMAQAPLQWQTIDWSVAPVGTTRDLGDLRYDSYEELTQSATNQQRKYCQDFEMSPWPQDGEQGEVCGSDRLTAEGLRSAPPPVEGLPRLCPGTSEVETI